MTTYQSAAGAPNRAWAALSWPLEEGGLVLLTSSGKSSGVNPAGCRVAVVYMDVR